MRLVVDNHAERNAGAFSRPMAAAGSMALLMALPENEQNDVIARNGRRYRNHGALSEEQVRSMLLDSLDIGLGLNRSRIIAGISGVGVSIPTSAEAAYAALSIAAIDARILDEGRQRELLLMLKHEAQTISRELGCRGVSGSERLLENNEAKFR